MNTLHLAIKIIVGVLVAYFFEAQCSGVVELAVAENFAIFTDCTLMVQVEQLVPCVSMSGQ